MKIGTGNRKSVSGRQDPRGLSAGKLIKSVLSAAALGTVVTLTSQAVQPPVGVAPVTVPVGGFGIGGEVVAGATGVTAGDWMSGPGGAGVLDATGKPLNPATTFHFIDAFNSTSDNVFGANEKWVSNPNSWTWSISNKQAPAAKTDINNVLMHVATDANAHTWLILAGDRLSTAGDSYIDFELLQNTLVANANGTFTSAGTNGGRTVNDLLLSLAFNNGGTTADFLAWRWQSDGNGGFTYTNATASLPVGEVFVAVNTNSASVPFGAFGQTSYTPNAFAEAAIDMTALMGAFDPCLSIGIKTIMVKTKTSTSSSSSISDFITPIQYTLRLGPSSYAGPNQSVCSQGSSTAFALQGQATPGILPIASTTWSVVSGSATIDSASTLNTTARVSSSSATLRLTVVQANGCTETSDVILTVAPLPTCSISGPASVCPNSSFQFSGPDGMTGYTWSINGNGAISGASNGQLVNVTAGSACGTGFTLSLTSMSDSCSSTCSSLVQVTATVPPTVTAPANLTLAYTADISPATTGTATFQDTCTSVTLSYSDSVSVQPDGSQIISRNWLATDSCGNNASSLQTITVNPPSSLVLPFQGNLSVSDLSPLNVTNTAINPNSSSSSLTYQLVNSPAGASIDANGIISWTPTLAQSPSTNVFTTIVSTTVVNANGSTTVSATNSFVVIVSGPYDGLDMLSDSDGDGLTNLVEYAVGGDALNPTDGNEDLVIFITQDSGSHYLAMTYKRRTNAEALGLQYLPEVSYDKVNWYSDASHVLGVSVSSVDSQFDSVTIRDTTPILSSAARFIRLHVISGNLESTSPIWIGNDTLVYGNGGNVSRSTLFSQRMVRPVLSAGVAASLQDALLSSTNGAATNGQFGTNGIAAYVEFDNGATADIADSTDTTGNLVLAGSVGNLASAGDAYRIRAHFTIASLFGTNNEAGLTAGPTPALADNILLTMPDTQRTITIFYSSFVHDWLLSDRTTRAGNQVVYPEQGVVVRRIQASDAHVYLCGPVKTGVAMVPVQPGYNLVGTLKSLSSVSLDGLNLYTGDSSTGLVGGSTPSTADNLLVTQPNGSSATYFYYTNGIQGWVDGGRHPAGTVQILPGSAFLIKRAHASAFTWTIPAE
jgi:hypothetical protein